NRKGREAKNERIDGHKRQDSVLAKDSTTLAPHMCYTGLTSADKWAI
ncbi:25404_t:CDS:2, partial [Racocetra persica]